MGASVPDQALVPTASSPELHRVSTEGFDPSRLTEHLEGIAPDKLAPIIKKAADDFYCTVLETAEDYLRDNLAWNIKSHIQMLERENQRMRTELWDVDRKLGGNMLGPESRLKSISDLQDASNGYYQLVWQVEKKFEGETRHETAMRYIKERESASCDGRPKDGDAQQAPLATSAVPKADAQPIDPFECYGDPEPPNADPYTYGRPNPRAPAARDDGGEG